MTWDYIQRYDDSTVNTYYNVSRVIGRLLLLSQVQGRFVDRFIQSFKTRRTDVLQRQSMN